MPGLGLFIFKNMHGLTAPEFCMMVQVLAHHTHWHNIALTCEGTVTHSRRCTLRFSNDLTLGG